MLAQAPAAKLSNNSVPLQAVPANISSMLTGAATSTQAGSSPAPSMVCIAPMLLPALLNGIQLQQSPSSIGATPALQLSNGAQLLTLLGQGLAPASSISVTSSVEAPATVLAATAAAGHSQLVLSIQLDAQSTSCLGTTPCSRSLSLPRDLDWTSSSWPRSPNWTRVLSPLTMVVQPRSRVHPWIQVQPARRVTSLSSCLTNLLMESSVRGT